MRTATVRDLRYNFPAVERALAAGETITITKRGKPVAELAPPRPVQPEKIVVPDVMARLRRIWGDKELQTSAVDLLRWDRDRY